jgi:hypothetical protein
MQKTHFSLRKFYLVMSLIFLDKALSTVIIFMYGLQKIRTKNWPARSPDLTPLDFFSVGPRQKLGLPCARE